MIHAAAETLTPNADHLGPSSRPAHTASPLEPGGGGEDVSVPEQDQSRIAKSTRSANAATAESASPTTRAEAAFSGPLTLPVIAVPAIGSRASFPKSAPLQPRELRGTLDLHSNGGLRAEVVFPA